MKWPNLPTNKRLAELLRQAKSHKMTPEELDAQRRSWVRGNLMLCHPEMTLDEANAIMDRANEAGVKP